MKLSCPPLQLPPTTCHDEPECCFLLDRLMTNSFFHTLFCCLTLLIRTEISFTLTLASVGNLDNIKLPSSASAADDALAWQLACKLLLEEGQNASNAAPPAIGRSSSGSSGSSTGRSGVFTAAPGSQLPMRLLTAAEFVRDCDLGLIQLEPSPQQRQVRCC